MSRYQPYGAAYANLARRRREAARDPHTDAAKAVLFGAALRGAVDESARPGGVVDLLTRRLLDLAGYVRCRPCDLYGEPGGVCPNGHPLAAPGGESGG